MKCECGRYMQRVLSPFFFFFIQSTGMLTRPILKTHFSIRQPVYGIVMGITSELKAH